MISLCITTYNRYELLFESFAQVIDDERISEIVIVDDCSNLDLWNKLCVKVGELNNQYPKIKLYRNEQNLGCYHNKRMAVSKASNEWVILFDSDNIIDKKYIDVLSDKEWHTDLVIQPVYAKPHFDFSKYSAYEITTQSAHKFSSDATFCTALNAMNYFVNRDEFLRVFEDRSEPWTADSILINYNWLNAGNSIYFCPGLEYEHRIHDGSHYKEHHRKTGNLYNEIVNKLKAMR